MKLHRALVSTAAAAALLVGFALPSQAALILTITDGSDVESVTGSGGVAVFNSMSPSDPLAGFSFVVAVGLSKPMVGSAHDPVLDLDLDVVSTGSGGTLTFRLTDTNFEEGSSPRVDFLSSVGGTFDAGGSLKVKTSMDCDNDRDGDGITLTSQDFSGSSFAGGKNAHVRACPEDYSLTETLTLTLPGDRAQFSGDANLAIPEPASLALMGMGLLAFGAFARRRGTTKV